MNANTDILLQMRGIIKQFPGVLALDRVDFEVRAGEVHALMGQNGAGKSTLIKVLTGVYPKDGGDILFEGREFHAGSPAEAQRKGISAIYQEVNLIPSLTVAENLFLGRAPKRWWGIDHRAMRLRAREILKRFDLNIDVDQNLGSLSIAIQQMVGIARAVDIESRLIIMDEPTSSLDAHETSVLFELINRLKQQGMGILFITHFLEQVYRVSDRITVLRNGRNAGTFESARLPKVDLVAHMIGRSPAEVDSLISGRSRESIKEPGAIVLDARGLGQTGKMAPFDLAVRQGEVVGFAGLLGSGRTEAARLLFGADRPEMGTIQLNNHPASTGSPRKSIAGGMAMTPEERKTEGIIPGMSVLGNLILVAQRRLSRLGIVSKKQQERIARDFIQQLGIVLADLHQPVRNLSGGNQQKVLLARWLAANPSLLILDEPTRGIDVGAKGEIEKLIEDLSHEGKAIVFISAELDEVIRRSHRIAIFRDRAKVGELTDENLNESAIMNVIAGQQRDAA